MTDCIDQEADAGEDQVGDEQSDRLGVVETCQILESGDRDEEADSPDDEGRKSKELSVNKRRTR